MGIFEFSGLTEKDIKGYAENSFVFNRLRSDIESEKVIVNSISNEEIGCAEENLNVAIRKGDGEWELLDIQEKIASYNEIPLGYLIGSLDYDSVLVIIRRMSNFVFDKKGSSANSYIYSVMLEEYKNLKDCPSLSGFLAKNKIYLNKDFTGVCSSLEEKFGKDSVEYKETVDNIKKIMEGS